MLGTRASYRSLKAQIGKKKDEEEVDVLTSPFRTPTELHAVCQAYLWKDIGMS